MSNDPGSDEKPRKPKAEGKGMTPEQLRAKAAADLDDLLRRRRVEVDGKVMSLKRFQRHVEELRKLYESGAFDETVRTMPRWMRQQLVPGDQLRPGAYKQQLRQYEEAKLELDRFGEGIVTSARPVVGKLLGGRRDFAWAIFARPDQAEKVLSASWKGRDQDEAVRDQRLYLDVINNCHNMELTLMVLTSRPLPLAPLRDAMAARLERSMVALNRGQELAPQHKADLQNFVSMFGDERLAPAPWVDAKARCIKAGTHLIFSTSQKGHMLVEAISPGRLMERRMYQVCVNRSPLVTASVFDAFLGQQPLDQFGKEDVGTGMTWVANGFRFRPWEARQGQYIAWEDENFEQHFPPPTCEVHEGPLRPSMFQLLDEQTRPLRRMLLGGVRRARRQEASLQGA